LKNLLGFPSDAPVVKYYTQIAGTDIAESARRTIDLVQAKGTKWAVEELVAMKFACIKHLTKLVANERVTDVVVALPLYYFQFAIEISGLRILAIINDGTAVAMNFAMTRTFPTPEYHVIYNTGSSRIKATVALVVHKELNAEREIAEEQKCAESVALEEAAKVKAEAAAKSVTPT